MRNFFAKYGLKTAIIFAGAIAGYAYYFYVGCASGSCPISSNPYLNTGYGALIGFLLSGIIVPKQQSNKQKDNKTQ